jgi:hypothetical protein
MWKTVLRRKKKRNSSKLQQKSPQTLASEITNPSALPFVFLQPKKGHTVRQM